MNPRNPAFIAFAFLGFSALPLHTFAQYKSSDKRTKSEFPNIEKTLWLQINPLALAEPESAIAITASYKTGKFISVGLEAGVFVAYNEYFDSVSITPYSGFRFKPEVKFYPNGERKGPRNFYISLRGMIKNSSRPREEWLNGNNGSGQGSFARLVDYKEKKWVYGLATIVGAEFIMGPRKRFMIDMFGGLGLRYKKYHAEGLPAGFTVNYGSNDGWDFDLKQNGTFPYLSLGFKLGYRIL